MQKIKQKPTKSAYERLDALEGALMQVAQASNNAVNELNTQLSILDEMMDAVVQAIGQEKVDQILVDSRRAKDVERAQKEQAWVESNLAAGKIALVPAVTDKTLIVGVERDADGNVLGGGRGQVHYTRLPEESKKDFLGKGLGDTISVPASGNTFEILGLYETVLNAKKTGPVEAPAPAAVGPATTTQNVATRVDIDPDEDVKTVAPGAI